MTRPRPLVLCILDGFGVSPPRDDNAVTLAAMPRYRALLDRYPATTLGASGPDVGLPAGQMGNSEVGHLNFGAGRVAQMDISRIDCAVADGSLGANVELAAAIAHAAASGGRLHLMGLLSDGGVHSSLDHLLALIDVAAARGVEVWVHAFLDGRDTPPRSALGYVDALEARLRGKGAVATVSGRYYAMDRDQRWERVQAAHDAIVTARGPRAPSARAAVEASYAAGKDDEFAEPVVVGAYAGADAAADAAIFFNFRADRARELSAALTQATFDSFARPAPRAFARFVCMTEYDARLALPVAFAKVQHAGMLGEVLSAAGLTQLRCAETEKFAHVTFFFNGGREAPFDGETRALVPSPRDVATYDLKPEMSAARVAEEVVRAIEGGAFDVVVVNFANPDMVGHTGVLAAAIAALEAVDAGLGAVVDAALARGGATLVTADHGNCEQMRDPVTGAPHTAHTTNPVRFVLVDESRRDARLREGGRLADVAPTMLQLLGIAAPAEMTGQSLLAP